MQCPLQEGGEENVPIPPQQQTLDLVASLSGKVQQKREIFETLESRRRCSFPKAAADVHSPSSPHVKTAGIREGSVGAAVERIEAAEAAAAAASLTVQSPQRRNSSMSQSHSDHREPLSPHFEHFVALSTPSARELREFLRGPQGGGERDNAETQHVPLRLPFSDEEHASALDECTSASQAMSVGCDSEEQIAPAQLTTPRPPVGTWPTDLVAYTGNVPVEEAASDSVAAPEVNSLQRRRPAEPRKAAVGSNAADDYERFLRRCGWCSSQRVARDDAPPLDWSKNHSSSGRQQGRAKSGAPAGKCLTAAAAPTPRTPRKLPQTPRHLTASPTPTEVRLMELQRLTEVADRQCQLQVLRRQALRQELRDFAEGCSPRHTARSSGRAGLALPRAR